MSVVITFSKAQIFKIIQPGRFFGSWLDNSGVKALIHIDVFLATDNLPWLGSNLTSNAIHKFVRKIREKELLGQEKG